MIIFIPKARHTDFVWHAKQMNVKYIPLPGIGCTCFHFQVKGELTKWNIAVFRDKCFATFHTLEELEQRPKKRAKVCGL